MTTRTSTWPFPARIKTELQIDTVLLTIVLSLLLAASSYSHQRRYPYPTM